jgi:hypothetical protein
VYDACDVETVCCALDQAALLKQRALEAAEARDSRAKLQEQHQAVTDEEAKEATHLEEECSRHHRALFNLQRSAELAGTPISALGVLVGARQGNYEVLMDQQINPFPKEHLGIACNID